LNYAVLAAFTPSFLATLRAGEAVAKQLDSGAEVAIIEGIVTAFNGQQRALGLEDAATAAGLRIVARQSGQWEMEKANGIAAAMLSEHPALGAIFCANDSMAIGAATKARRVAKAKARRRAQWLRR
jgi:ribose transport system substrate-binding protein